MSAEEMYVCVEFSACKSVRDMRGNGFKVYRN